VRLIILLLLISGAVNAQTDLDRWLVASPKQNVSALHAREQLTPFIQSLSETRGSDLKLLRKTFHRIHNTFLKDYKAYSDFEEVFSVGQYDCLTATALFSYVLEQLKLRHDIIETNYHIFLIVKTTGGDVLIETTDKIGGFVIGEQAISERIGTYGKNKLDVDGHSLKYHYQYSFSLCHKISSEKLVGLMFFNQAVKAYNQQEWERCSELLETAYGLYASPRCEELGIILIRTLVDSSLDEKTKAACIARLRNYWAKNTQPLASN
jgi:hypothetical protein